MYEAFRRTKETSVKVFLSPKQQDIKIDVPVGFLRHMLELFFFNAGISAQINASGDTHVDDHHIVEDVAIVLGKALKDLWTAEARERYGWAAMPMDDTLVIAALDLSGRGSLVWKGTFPAQVRRLRHGAHTGILARLQPRSGLDASPSRPLRRQLAPPGRSKLQRNRQSFKRGFKTF